MCLLMRAAIFVWICVYVCVCDLQQQLNNIFTFMFYSAHPNAEIALINLSCS